MIDYENICGRNPGWIKCSLPIVTISVKSKDIEIITGRICSTGSGDHSANNIDDFVVGGDKPFYPMCDSGTDAYEKTFRADDPHAMTFEEVRYIRTSLERLRLWFNFRYEYSDEHLHELQIQLRNLPIQDQITDSEQTS